MRKDYYKILGVDKNATQEDIKKAFRKLSIQWHPDKFASESEEKKKEAEEKFKDINEANQVLSDPQKKSQYDNGGSFSFQDIFGNQGNPFWNPFGGFGFNMNVKPQNVKKYYPPGSDINIRISLSIEDLYNYDKPKIVSYNRQIRCQECEGIGGKGESECTYCNGTGMISESKVHGNMHIVNQRPCNHCQGTGKQVKEKCETCNGTGMKTVIEEIDINKEIPRQYLFSDNVVINVPELGNESRSKEMPNGALHVVINYTFDKKEYSIDKRGNIIQNIKVPYYECLLGNNSYTFIACDRGYHSIELPECTKNASIIECKEMHGAKNDAKYFVVINIDIPKELKDEEKKELEKIKEIYLKS